MPLELLTGTVLSEVKKAIIDYSKKKLERNYKVLMVLNQFKKVKLIHLDKKTDPGNCCYRETGSATPILC